jgi:O-antigen/teichoic acid export membrane protein
MSFDRNLAKDTINYGVGQILPKIISFLLIPVYVAYLSPAEFGLIELITSTCLFLTITMRFSLPGAITRFYFDFDSEHDLSRYVSTMFYGIIMISTLTGILFLIAFLFFGHTLLPGISVYPLFMIMLLASLLSSSSEVQKKLLQARRQSAYNAYLTLATTLVSVSVTILLVVVFKLGVLGATLSILATAVVFFIQAQVYLYKDLQLYFNKKLFYDSITYSMPLFVYHFLGSFAPVLSRGLLAEEVSLVSLGIFAMAYRVTQPLSVFSTAFASAYTPLYYALRKQGDTQESVRQVKETFGKIWAIATILCLGVIIFSKPFLFLLPDTIYLEGDVVLKILALGSLPNIFYLIVAQEIFYQKKTGTALGMNLLSIFLTIGFSIFLVKPLKELGIALSMITPALVNALLVYFLAKKWHEILVDWNFVFKSLALVLAVSLLCVFVLNEISWMTVFLLALVFLGSAASILFMEKSLMRVMRDFAGKLFM